MLAYRKPIKGVQIMYAVMVCGHVSDIECSGQGWCVGFMCVTLCERGLSLSFRQDFPLCIRVG